MLENKHMKQSRSVVILLHSLEWNGLHSQQNGRVSFDCWSHLVTCLETNFLHVPIYPFFLSNTSPSHFDSAYISRVDIENYLFDWYDDIWWMMMINEDMRTRLFDFFLPFEEWLIDVLVWGDGYKQNKSLMTSEHVLLDWSDCSSEMCNEKPKQNSLLLTNVVKMIIERLRPHRPIVWSNTSSIFNKKDEHPFWIRWKS